MTLLPLLLVAQIAGRQAIVYTTAESTTFRLTATDTLTFKASEPTSEGKLYVFVDPRKTFQPFLGIGGPDGRRGGDLRQTPRGPSG